jgi:phosphoglucomutase
MLCDHNINCLIGIGPAPENVTKEIEKAAKLTTSYKIGREPLVIDTSVPGNTSYGQLVVEVIDTPDLYSSLMAVSIFDLLLFPYWYHYLQRLILDTNALMNRPSSILMPFVH